MSDYGTIYTTYHHDYNSGADYYTTYDKDNNVVYSGPYKDEADLARHKLQKQSEDEYRATDEYQQWKKENPEEAAEQEARDQKQYEEWGVADEPAEGAGGGSGSEGFIGAESYEEATYNGPMTEPAPAFTPMTEPAPPDPKIVPLLAGTPTNSFATGNPIDYPGTDTADPETPGPDSPAPMHTENKKSEVDVKAIMDNVSDAAAASAAIAAAVTDAIANKAVAIAAEYSAKMIALPASIPGRISSYTSARVGKTKDDVDRNGQPYEPVKLSLGDIMPQMTASVEDLDEEKKEANNNQKKNKKADEAKKKASKFIESAQKIAAKSAETVAKITSHVAEGAEWMQQNVDKEIARAEKNITQELETGYKKIEKDIDDFCQDEGDKIGTNIVRLYNKALEKQAKKIVDEKNKIEKKAKIKANAAIQKAMLKIFALIGL